VSYLISWKFHDVQFSDLGNGFEYLGSNHDTVFGYFLVNIFVSFVGYGIGFVACSMAIQKISFALPITLMTPISFLIALGCEKSWWAADWLFDQKLQISHKQLVVAICVCFATFLAQSLSTTYYIWRSQDFIMAKESQLFWVPSYNGIYISFIFLGQGLLYPSYPGAMCCSMVNDVNKPKRLGTRQTPSRRPMVPPHSTILVTEIYFVNLMSCLLSSNDSISF
jgi:hypothetical protein